jgi:hypothetical protein
MSRGQVAFTHRETVEQIIALALRFRFEDLDVFEDLRVYLDLLMEPHRVFTQEIEDDFVGRLERDMLVPQGTTSDGVRLVLALLVARSEGETVDEVQCRCALTVRSDL